MKRTFLAAIALLGGVICTGLGWVAHDVSANRACHYTANGYGRLDTDVHALPELSLEEVNQDVIGEIQKCWAAHPYTGPQHVMMLAEARKMPGGGHYLLFEPWGITDIQLAFSVDGNRRVTGAYVRSMF